VRFQATEEQIESILEHAQADYDPEDIAELVFHSRHHRHVERVIGILREFDTEPDHVAMERASRGDSAAWAGLTRLERDLVLVAARKRRQAEMDERREWVEIFRKHAYGASGGDALPHTQECPDWMVALAGAAGWEDPGTVMKQGRLAELRLGG
jgi:hypothetical protein